MKYGKFVSKESVPFTKKEKEMFKDYFKGLVERYDKSLKCEVEILSTGELIINFISDEPKSFRNRNMARIIDYSGFSFMIWKSKGYLENFDWIQMKKIDESKPRENYQDAPEFSYSTNLVFHGKEIRYKCRTEQSISLRMPTYQYGTELTDFNYFRIVDKIFTQTLKPR